MPDPTQSAFPRPTVGLPNGGCEYGEPGLSARTYIAARALQGLLAAPETYSAPKAMCDKDGVPVHHYADMAVRYADALIARLNRLEVVVLPPVAPTPPTYAESIAPKLCDECKQTIPFGDDHLHLVDCSKWCPPF